MGTIGRLIRTERLATLLSIGATIGLYNCERRAEPTSVAVRPQLRPSALASLRPPVAYSASPPPDAARQIAEFCDLRHGAAAELNPTSVSPKGVARTNPFTGQPVTVRPRKLTPEQRVAARRVVERVPRATIREGCQVLDLGNGARLVMVGLETSCETGCRFHARQLDRRTAEFVMDLATAASMTIDVDDHVFIPAAVKSAHAGESYATIVSTPDELAKLVLSRFVGGWTRYRGPSR